MDSGMITATWQGAAISGLSNVVAQVFQSYKQDRPFSIHWTDLFQFVLFSILSTPPNYMWQKYLEERYPAYTTDDGKPASDKKTDENPGQKEPKLNYKNTIMKFLLDQTIGATINTFLFIAGMDLIRGRTGEDISKDLRKQFWQMIVAGYKMWPAVSLLNFAVVPMQYRMLVGGVVGLVWNVYLSLASSSQK